MFKVTIATLVAFAHATELKSLTSSMVDITTGSFPFPANVANNYIF